MRTSFLFVSVLSLAMFFVMKSGAAGGQGGDPVSVIVPSGSANSRALAGAAGTLIARRDTYDVYEVSPDRLADISRIPGASARPDFDLLELRRETIDTGEAAARAPAPAAAEGGGSLMLLQFAAPPVDADLDLIRAAGGRIVQYVPENAYLVWAPGDAGKRLTAARESNTMIRYTGPFLPSYALSPRLDDRLEDGELVPVTVQFFNYGPGARESADRLFENAWEVISAPRVALGGRYINTRLLVPGTEIGAIARLPGVVNVEPYTPPQLFGERQDQIVAANLNGSLTQPSGPGYLTWLSNYGFPSAPSSYPIVVVTDDGFDNGNASNPANSEFRELNSPSNASRAQYAEIAPGASGITSPNGVAGHGNINCSIVGGYNNGTGTPANVDSDGYHYGLGVSPYGRIASTKLFQDGGGWGYPDEAQMVSNQYGAGTRVSSNSWGCGYFFGFGCAGNYDTDSQNYDGWTRDSQSGTTGNQELLFVFSAGNDGGYGSNTIGTPGTAKNVIAVGASENYDLSGTDGCGVTDSDADDALDMAWFSSRGPCDDSRVKPDIVAPGTHIHGAASYDPSYDGTGVCDKYEPSGQTKYALSSGTSHSCPAISGCVSLIHNFLGRIYSISTPSPALLKAYVIHAGRHITGTGANDDFPSNNQGYGIIDLATAFDTGANRLFVNQTHLFTASGQAYELSGNIYSVNKPLRVALAWTDAPGATFSNAWVNNLDLEVTVGGTLYRGNNFSKGTSVSGGSADTRNNTECVFLPAGSSGAVTVRVKATSIVGDGVPGNGDATDQDFALVVYNVAGGAVPTATPLPTPTPAPTPLPPGLRVWLNRTSFNSGDTAEFWVSFTQAIVDWDGYLVVVGNGGVWSVAGGRLQPGVHPIVANAMERSLPFLKKVFSLRVPFGVSGDYTVYAGILPAGTDPTLQNARGPFSQLASTGATVSR